MGKLIYIKIRNSRKSAHQYVHIDGERIGEIWREQIETGVAKATSEMKWRWFAKLHDVDLPSGGNDRPMFCNFGYVSKDKAVDQLEQVFAAQHNGSETHIYGENTL